MEVSEEIMNIFNSMSTGSKEVNSSFAKEWIEKVFKHGEYLNRFNKFVFHPEAPWSSEQDHRERIMVSLTQNLFNKERSGKLVEILVTQMFPYNKATRIVKSMKNQLEYCSSQYMSSAITPDDRADYFVLHNAINCIDLIMIPIAAILFAGNQVVLAIPNGHPLTEFYCFLHAQAIECGLPEDAVVIRPSQVPPPTPFSSLGLAPIIVFNDGDLSSAADAVVLALCDRIYEVPWSPSHIFVQEGVFPSFVELMKKGFEKVKFGSRLNKFVDCDFKCLPIQMPSMSNFETTKLQVYEPAENFPVKLCIGWDPLNTHLDKSLHKYCVPVLPFGTVAQAISNVKKLSTSNFISAWTGSVNTAKQISDLQFPTIWLNCHGRFCPSVPVQIEYTPFFDFMKFSHFLTKRHLFEPNEPEKPFGTRLNMPIREHSSVAPDFKTALEKANKSSLAWSKKSLTYKLWDFMELIKNNNHIPDNILAKMACPSVGQPDNSDVTARLGPCGIAILPLKLTLYPELYDQLIATVAYITAAGNAVILMGINTASISLAVLVAEQFSKLPRGLVTVVEEELKLDDAGNINDSSLKPLSLSGGNLSNDLVFTYYETPCFLGKLFERITYVWNPL